MKAVRWLINSAIVLFLLAGFQILVPIQTNLIAGKLPDQLGWMDGSAEHRLWVAIGIGLACTVLAGVRSVPWLAKTSSEPAPPPVAKAPDWAVPRPAELAAVRQAMVPRWRRASRTVVLSGPGGSGKSTLSRLVGEDRRVGRYFRRRIFVITVGRGAQDSRSLAVRINEAGCVFDVRR